MSLRRKIRRRGQTPDRYLQIVYTPLPQAAHTALSAEFREQASRLHVLVHEQPDAAVTELRAWIAREPNPMIFNWLGIALGMLGDEKAVEETVRENFRRNPTYLFARLNHAELCLRNGDLAGAREALGESLDLRAALGGRRRVHVSEVAGYFYAVGLYHLQSGDRDAAERVYEMLAEAAPGEPGTEALGNLLRPRPQHLFSR